MIDILLLIEYIYSNIYIYIYNNPKVYTLYIYINIYKNKRIINKIGGSKLTLSLSCNNINNYNNNNNNSERKEEEEDEE